MIDDYGFDTGIDFDFEDYEPPEFNRLDVCGIVEKINSKKKSLFDIESETKQLCALLRNPPRRDECFKMVSVKGGFSSIGIIKFIADAEPIEQLYASTLRIGQKQFQILCELKKRGRLNSACFLTSTMQESTDKTYNYFDYIFGGCQKNGWMLKTANNHSKIILMKTAHNFYVVETSSNLNANPKMEQFSFENDETLYKWYEKLFIELCR